MGKCPDRFVSASATGKTAIVLHWNLKVPVYLSLKTLTGENVRICVCHCQNHVALESETACVLTLEDFKRGKCPDQFVSATDKTVTVLH